mmetsp:Transcript_2478/g.7614  ORF Transcript_2478/g.7614 Transcript_2478/m.7614 type:complete len:210 (-) Transcript_2478:321-950(-)
MRFSKETVGFADSSSAARASLRPSRKLRKPEAIFLSNDSDDDARTSVFSSPCFLASDMSVTIWLIALAVISEDSPDADAAMPANGSKTSSSAEDLSIACMLSNATSFVTPGRAFIGASFNSSSSSLVMLLNDSLLLLLSLFVSDVDVVSCCIAILVCMDADASCLRLLSSSLLFIFSATISTLPERRNARSNPVFTSFASSMPSSISSE